MEPGTPTCRCIRLKTMGTAPLPSSDTRNKCVEKRDSHYCVQIKNKNLWSLLQNSYKVFQGFSFIQTSAVFFAVQLLGLDLSPARCFWGWGLVHMRQLGRRLWLSWRNSNSNRTKRRLVRWGGACGGPYSDMIWSAAGWRIGQTLDNCCALEMSTP